MRWLPRFLVLFLVIVFGFGCAKLNPKKLLSKETQPATAFQAEESETLQRFIVSGKVHDDWILENGGEIAVLPFRAGPGIAANEDLDKIVFRVIKGLSDELKDKRPYFRIMVDENAGLSNLVLDGHVIEKKEPSSMRKFFSRKDKRTLAIRGKMIDRKSGKIVMHFMDRVESEKQTETFNDLGLRLGQNLGKFIIQEANK